QDLGEEGMTVVIVPREVGFAKKGAPRLFLIDRGGMAKDATPHDLITHPPPPRLRESLQPVS
ncbi:amino acid ABC transporter ATP-binding protein, partial [Serratia marcescens]|uniref:amino acid ABC transporter ATP-binding protein n=1 Tax=Serratia marcescens TaxID=615 RepID=UPI000DA0ED11